MPTRRSLLEGIGAALGIAGVGATAGCLGSLTGGGGGGAPAYASSLYDPSTVVSESPIHGFAVYDLGTAYEYRDRLPGEMASQIERYDESFDAVSLSELGTLTVEGYTTATIDDLSGMNTPSDVTAGGAGFLEGSFQPEGLRDLLETQMATSGSGAELAADGSIAGHDLYTVENAPTENAPSVTMGMSSDSVGMGMTANADATGKDALRPMLEGAGGYVDTGDPARLLVNAFDDPTTANGVVADIGSAIEQQGMMSVDDANVEATLSGLQGAGSGGTVGDQEVTSQIVGVYAEGEAPSQDNLDAVMSMIEEQMSRPGTPDLPMDQVEVSVSGRVVTASFSQDTDEMFQGGLGGMGGPAVLMAFPFAAVLGTFVLGIGSGMGGGGMGGGRAVTPTATFEFEYEADAGRVTITMTAGDVLNEDNSRAVRYGVRGESLSEWSLPVQAGDQVTVENVEPGDTIVVVWESPDGSRTDTLMEFDVPA